MDRRTLALVSAGLVIAFLLGFVPEMIAKRNADRDLAAARHELALAKLQGRLGAALAESLRSNYERSRQLMAGYFSGLQDAIPAVTDARQKTALNGILGQRDELITLLSRAQPESSQRLMLLYTAMFSAIDPQGALGPAVTPSPLPPPAPSSTESTPRTIPRPAPAAPAPAAPAPAAPRATPAKPAGARP
jgi:hypothetical protein